VRLRVSGAREARAADTNPQGGRTSLRVFGDEKFRLLPSARMG
jgi:hypothetical protein